jgi:8-oxo-dGTP pyrophosphatase MutT (NUDIX family)
MTSRHEALLAELRKYKPADELESCYHRALIELLTSAPDAFSRAHFTPGHVTAGCFIVDPAAGSLLLHHHRRLDRWLQMGGHVDGDESPVAAALREGEEESGLHDLELLFEGIFDVDVHFIPAGKGEPDHHHFDVRYLVRTSDPSAIAIDRNESKDLAWVPFDRAIPLMNEEASVRAIVKIISVLSAKY